tara:strand:+ start:4963 stop:7932 length:2970 start_codon:yes stop_codon:yes gene_type:complete
MSNGRKIADLVVGTNVKVTQIDSDLDNTISSLKTRLDSDDAKLQSLDTAISAGIVNLADSDLIISQLQAKINSAIANVDSDSAALQNANTQIQSIKSRLDSDEGRVQALNTSLASEILSTNTEISSIKGRLDSDDGRLQLLDTNITLIKTRLDSDETSIQAAKSLIAQAVSGQGMSDSDLKVVADLRNQLDSEIQYVKNIQISYTNYLYVATAGQTSFTGTDSNSVTLAYTAGSIIIFLNGVKLEAEDFTATDGTTIVLADPAQVNAELAIIVPKLESNIAPITYSWTGVVAGTRYRGSVETQDDDFGFSVDVDSAGTTVIGGAYKEDDKGVIYVFKNNTEVATLRSSDKAHNDYFGKALSISGDGNTIIAASPGKAYGGHAYAFTLSGSTWSQLNIIEPSDNGNSDQFGSEVNLNKNGDTVIISSPRKSVYVGPSLHSLAGAAYIFKGPGTTGFNIASPSYVQGSSAFSTQDTVPRGFLFNGDGTKLYIMGANGDKFYTYSLSTAYDVSTTSYDGSSYDVTVNAGLGEPRDCRWSMSGTRCFILDYDDERIYQMALTTAYDLSTASYQTTGDVSSCTNPTGFDVSSDGKTILVLSAGNQQVHQFTLSDPNNISTMSPDNISPAFSISSQESDPRSITFNEGGGKMFIVGRTNKIYQYNLPNPFKIATTLLQNPRSPAYDNISLDISSYETRPQQIAFSAGGTGIAGAKLYLIGHVSDKIHQWTSTLVTTTWTQQAKFVAANARPDELFGTKTALSADGNIAVVANATHPQFLNGLTIFTRTGETWIQSYIIPLPHATPHGSSADGYNPLTSQFGRGVDISDNGERIVVTSANTTVTGTPIIYIYDKSDSDAYSLSNSFVMSSTAADNTTDSVGISGDGNQIAVGDSGWKHYFSGGNFPNVGCIAIYEYNAGTSSWSLKTRLLGGTMGENMGESLAFSKGTIPTVVGGAPQHDILDTDGVTQDGIYGNASLLGGNVSRDVGAVYRFVAS